MFSNTIQGLRLDICTLTSECKALAERVDLSRLAGNEPRGALRALSHKQSQIIAMRRELDARLSRYYALIDERERLDDLGAPTAHLSQAIERMGA